MTENSETRLRLSAQRALWGSIPPVLRAASVELRERVLCCRFIYDREPSAQDLDLASGVAAEIAADFPSDYSIHEEREIAPVGTPMKHLEHIVFLRFE